jgi:hypothetical protein
MGRCPPCARMRKSWLRTGARLQCALSEPRMRWGFRVWLCTLPLTGRLSTSSSLTRPCASAKLPAPSRETAHLQPFTSHSPCRFLTLALCRYLNVPNIISAAIGHGCTMLHPGYGFLAENATFVDICKDHGLNFIGPNVSPFALKTFSAVNFFCPFCVILSEF